MNKLEKEEKFQQECEKTISVTRWQYGASLLRVKSENLWRFAVDAEGRPEFQSFEQWVQARRGLSLYLAYRYMDVASAYDEDTCKKIGFSNAAFIVTAPMEYRSGLINEAKLGASTRAIREKVFELKAQTGYRRETGRKQMPVEMQGSVSKNLRTIGVRKTANGLVFIVEMRR